MLEQGGGSPSLKPSSSDHWKALLPVGACLLVLFVAYILVFLGLMPFENDGLGNDYSSGLPRLMAGLYWGLANGVTEQPWFVPSFCGGVFLYPSPGASFYSVPQLLVTIVSPLVAFQWTFLLFAALGFVGAVLSSGRAFGLSPLTSLFVGAVFMFNGFYAYRMLIGHAAFHSFMLLPFLALFCIAPIGAKAPKDKTQRWSKFALAVALSALTWVYVIESGAFGVVLQFTLALAIVILLHNLVRGFSWQPWFIATCGGLLGLLMSAGRLSAIASLQAELPRTDYKLAGTSISDALYLLFNSLFIGPVEDAASRLKNLQVAQSRHEWEYGVGPVVLIVLVFAAIKAVRVAKAHAIFERIRGRDVMLPALGLAFALAIPLALNVYTPEWNATIKSIPILNAMSNMLRWNLAYIPFLAFLSGICLDWLMNGLAGRAWRVGIVVGAVGILVAINAFSDKSYYRSQAVYPAEPMNAAHALAMKTGKIVPIQGTGVYLDGQGRVAMPLNRDDTFVKGDSQLACYEPQFGYSLEKFPQKSLQPGPAMSENNGVFNFKNPACYVFPKENKCMPGDHFRLDQRADLERFLSYKPFQFEKSSQQKAAEGIAALAWIFALAVCYCAAVFLRSRARADLQVE